MTLDGQVVSPSARPIWVHAAARPDVVAVADPRTTLSYAALRDAVAGLAERFRSIGVAAGEPVLVLLDVCVESVVAFWALRAIGAVVVVGDPTAKDSEIRYCLDKTGARHSVAGLRATASLAPPAGTAWHFLQEGPSGRAWALQTRAFDATSERPDFGDDPSVVLFSSGTTGRPKAILHTTASLVGLHETLKRTWLLRPGDRVLGALPFHTIYGLIFSAASTIHAGASLFLIDRFHPERALEAIEAYRITTAAFVPTMVLMMLGLEGRERFDLGSLRATYTASAPIGERDIARFTTFSGASLIANYGMSEIPGAAVELADLPHRLGSVGRVSPGFEVAVRGPDGSPLAAGETGEITLRGPSMMRCYLGDPGQTAERVRDGWIYTQDVGRIDEEGNIFLSGRTSEIIIRGGQNISPREVEAALAHHPDVSDAVVVGLPDEVFGQLVHAVIVPRGGPPRTREARAAMRAALLETCRVHLSSAKLPARIDFVNALPRNAGGKVVRSELARLLEAGEAAGRISDE